MKNIKTIRENKTKQNINWELNNAFISGWLCAKFEQEIQQIPDDCNIALAYDGITIYPTTRENCVTVLQIFGGKWNKEVEEYYKDKIKYSRSIENIFENDMKIVISQAPPPPSCRIEEVEELVPASVRKVKKMVCSKVEPNDEPVEVAETSEPVKTFEPTISNE